MIQTSRSGVYLGFLGRRWQRRQAGGAQDSASSTDKRRPRRILQSSGVRPCAEPGSARRERRTARDARRGGEWQLR